MGNIKLIEESVIFSPFKVTIELETIQEARGLYHRLNAYANEITDKDLDVCEEGDSGKSSCFGLVHRQLHDFMQKKSYLHGEVKSIESDKKSK